MRYGSVCSGIEAATQAWHPLGWTPAFFSEIEAFPSAVLAHHYGSNMPGQPDASNGVPNHGDMTKFEEWPDHAIELLVGGTPCQSFSVAGLRGGLDDARGNLMLTYGAIARRYRPRWLVWENVPGVLSSDGGRDFASLLGLLSGRRVQVPADGWRNAGIVEGYKGAYGLAWRVLDAQYVRVDGFEHAVPQRRRRVFVVGYSGDWRRAAAVLFEPEGLRGDSAPRREAGKRAAPTVIAGPSGDGGNSDGSLITASVPPTLNAAFGEKQGLENQHINGGCGLFVAHSLRAQSQLSHRLDSDNDVVARAVHDVAETLTSNGDAHSGFREAAGLVAHSLRAEGFDASEDGTGRGTPIVPVNYPAIAFMPTESFSSGDNVEVSPTLRVGSGIKDRGEGPAIAKGWAVRRLTPTECERLQGFPDDFTNVPYRGKPAADGPRYKALGNSMAVNAMRWIGQRIDTMEKIIQQREDAA